MAGCYLPFLSFDARRSSICARRCCGPGRQWPPTGRPAGCSRCCGPRFRGRGFSSGSTGLCDPGDLRFPGCGAPARLRRGDGEERGVAAASESAMGGPRAERGRVRPRTSAATPPARGTTAPGRDQGRSPPRRPRAAGQPAVRPDESAGRGEGRARGDRESDQGTARWAADRPHEPSSANQLRVFLTAAAYVLMQELRSGGAYCVCPQPGDVAAGPAAEAGGPRRPLGPPRGSAPRSTPHLEAWRHIALALGARAG